MSCFEVCDTHIDAMLTGGLYNYCTGYGQGTGTLRWFAPSDDTEGDYERGKISGPSSLEHYKQRKRELTPETAGRVGAMLVAENRRSVDHRYDETETEDPYVFTELPGRPDPVIVLKAIACYEYQSCEHPEWEESEAHDFCEALRDRMISSLPGYDDAPGWEIQDPEVFRKQPVTSR